MDAVRRILRVLRIAEQRTQQETGISAAQMFVLQQLGDARGARAAREPAVLSLSELADRTMTDRSSVTDVVERLVHRRLARRATDPGDARRAAVSITAKGRTLLRRAPQPPGALLQAALAKMPPKQLTAVGRALARLTSALGASHSPAPMLFADGKPPRARRSGRR